VISHQFVWMELFAQRVYKHLDPAQIERLEQQDKQLLLSFSNNI